MMCSTAGGGVGSARFGLAEGLCVIHDCEPCKHRCTCAPGYVCTAGCERASMHTNHTCELTEVPTTTPTAVPTVAPTLKPTTESPTVKAPGLPDGTVLRPGPVALAISQKNQLVRPSDAREW